MKRFLAVALIFAAAVVLCAWPVASAGTSTASNTVGMTKTVGVVDPDVNVLVAADAQKQMNVDASLGLGWVRIVVVWSPQQPDGFGYINQVCNAYHAADAKGMRILLNIIPGWNKSQGQHPPQSPGERRTFATLAAWYVQEVAQVCHTSATTLYFEVGNEVNNPYFWPAQFNADGTEAACVSFEQTLAWTYSAIKRKAQQVGIDVQVYAGGLSSTGNDDPHSSRPSTAPLTCIAKMGQAYRQSGRKNRIMDGLSLHPYGEGFADAPTTVHSDSTVGISDYPKLVRTLSDTFDGTGQPGTGLPILYSEYGVASITPPAKQRAYNAPPPAALHPVSESTQASYYVSAISLIQAQPNVVGLLFFLSRDDVDWRTGLFYADGSKKPAATAVRDALGGGT